MCQPLRLMFGYRESVEHVTLLNIETYYLIGLFSSGIRPDEHFLPPGFKSFQLENPWTDLEVRR